MKIFCLTTLLLIISLSSCKSEYEQRLSEAKELKVRMYEIKESNDSDDETLNIEIKELEDQINFHAKVSGNEELFYEELNL